MNDIETLIKLKYKMVTFDDISGYNLLVGYGRHIAIEIFKEYYPDNVFNNAVKRYVNDMKFITVHTESQYQYFRKMLIKELIKYENRQ